MTSHTLLRTLLAAAVIAIPAAASAAPNPGSYNPNGWNNGNATGQIQRGPQGRNDGRAHRDRDDRDDAVDRSNNGRSNGRYGNTGYGQNNGQFSGTVSSFSAFNLYLNNGQHVNLHQGTVINPTGTTLQPGMNVTVFGHGNNDGTFEADQINVIGNGNGYGQYGNNGNGNGAGGINLGSILGTLLGGLGR